MALVRPPSSKLLTVARMSAITICVGFKYRTFMLLVAKR